MSAFFCAPFLNVSDQVIAPVGRHFNAFGTTRITTHQLSALLLAVDTFLSSAVDRVDGGIRGASRRVQPSLSAYYPHLLNRPPRKCLYRPTPHLPVMQTLWYYQALLEERGTVARSAGPTAGGDIELDTFSEAA